MESEIQKHRVQIDQIDHQIRELLNKRATHAQSIGHLKGEKAIYRPEREAQVLRRAVADNAGPLPNSAIFRLQREVMSACLALEKPVRVGCVADCDLYGEVAARLQFGQSAQLQLFQEEVLLIEQVRLGQVDYGIIPLGKENGSSLLNLAKKGLSLCGEVFVSEIQNQDEILPFITFGKEAIPASGIDKTLVLLEGEMSALQDLIKERGVELIIQTEPVFGKDAVAQMLLLAVAGHKDSEPLKTFLKMLEEGSFPIRFISSYPDLSDCYK